MFKKVVVASTLAMALPGFAYAKDDAYVGGSLALANPGVDVAYGRGVAIGTGVGARLYAGTGKTYGKNHRLYLGKELNVDVAGSNYRLNNSRYGLGLSILPGYYITEKTRVYSRIGVEGQYAPGSNTFYGDTQYSFGPQLGVGVNTELNKNWDFRSEYTAMPSLINASKIGSLFGAGLTYKFN